MSLERVNDHLTKGKYIDFRLQGISESGKTKLWIINNSENYTELGRIAWFGRWRKYVFEPYENMVFEETCLRDISQFIEEETSAQRKAAAEKRKAAKA